MDKFCNEANYRFFNALANRTRLAMIDALMDKPKTAAEISEALNLELEASTQYLELMAGCMLLNAKGLGNEKRYSLKKEILEPMDELLACHMSKYCPALKKGIPEGKLKEHQKRGASRKASVEQLDT